jgi:molecular chaperone DnaK (HSP70)
MSDSECIVGIDLGTTNSEVAAIVGDRVQVLGRGGTRILPSCVGLTPSGELLIGHPARNQQVVYPERTLRSIKRKMGSSEPIAIADRRFTPAEASSLLLRELVSWATASLGREVKKAVITVPAYFSDAERNATREAGSLAGLEVVRILNEPTAASLAYGYGHGDGDQRIVMVYDLGGGTFDVSIVRTEASVTEVLATHGNTHLGGDDIDEMIVTRLLREFREQHGVELAADNITGRARLRAAAEQAKCELSSGPYARIREEALAQAGSRPLHLDFELARADFESMIRPLVESTLESVSRALGDAHLQPGDLDAVLLVGGSTRIPLVSEILTGYTGIAPTQEVHPELCVALGAGILAARIEGHDLDRVLVDVSPYSFGISYLGVRGGAAYPYCYSPLIERNLPLPITRTRSYVTAQPNQDAVHIQIFQGEDEDALRNLLVGDFHVEGLQPMYEPNEVLCRMQLDLDGILHVSAIEKVTGKSKRISIRGSLTPKSSEEVRAAQAKLESLYLSKAVDDAPSVSGLPGMVDWTEMEAEIDEDDLGEVGIENSAGAEYAAGMEDAAGTEDGAGTKQAVWPPDAAAERFPSGFAKGVSVAVDPVWRGLCYEADALLARSRGLLPRLHDDDKEEAVDLNEAIVAAMGAGDRDALIRARDQLKELLFFIQGNK